MNVKPLVLAAFFVSTFLVSCDKKSEEVDRVDRTNTSGVLLAEITPMFANRVNNDSVAVAFFQTAMPYYLNLKERNSTEVLKRINNAIEENVPVALYIYEGTKQIARVEKASEKSTKRFREVLSTEPEFPKTKENLGPIPSLAALNALWSQITSASIPFAYPVDGCFARAHKMRQIIRSNGYDSAKQFAYGNLAARGLSGCCVEWSYHVAPVVRSRNPSNVIQVVILDPSLFTGPVSIPTWMNKIKDTTCKPGASISTQAMAAESVYLRGEFGELAYDNSYSSTDCVLSALAGLNGCSTFPPPAFYTCLY